MQRGKTYKREIAFLLLCWMFYLSVWGPLAALEILVWPLMVFVLGAYGLDEYSKNIIGNLPNAPSSGMRRASVSPDGRGTERSSERPSGAGEQPDDRSDK